MATTAITTSGEVLQRWRKARRMSQLDLSAATGVSQRHLSFLETGRATPSREMIIHLATQLDVPLRERNVWLRAAGYADAYTEHDLDESAMDQVRHVLEMLLKAHQPFPAYVVDRAWNLVIANQSAQTLMSMFVTADTAALFQGNVLRLFMHPDGLRQHIVNWKSAAAMLLHRFERELADRPDDVILAELLEEVRSFPGVGDLPDRPETPTGADLLVMIHLRTPAAELRFLTTIATIGAPFDVTLEELRLETLLPADAATEATLRSLAGDA
ncbi:MAG: helix-turn-helix transcriptional regulator [Actinomycetota bacterium]